MPHIEVIARGIATRHDHSQIFLCRSLTHGHTYLPGGHVEFAEPAPSALIREMEEETGLRVSVEQFAGVFAACFDQRGRVHHEINMVFHMKHPWPDPIESREDDIAFEWIDLGNLETASFLPSEAIPLVLGWARQGGRSRHMMDHLGISWE